LRGQLDVGHVLPDGFQRIRYYGFLGNRVPRTEVGTPPKEGSLTQAADRDLESQYESQRARFGKKPQIKQRSVLRKTP